MYACYDTEVGPTIPQCSDPDEEDFNTGPLMLPEFQAITNVYNSSLVWFEPILWSYDTD
jgi:hypothetical protein